MSATKARAGISALPKVGAGVAPVAGAHHWTLFRLTTKQVKNPETERTRQQTFTERMRGDADDDGVVIDVWPVSEFKPKHVLARWGAGKYRVDWYNSKNDRIDGEVFEVSEPRSKMAGRSSSRLAPEDDDAEPSPRGRREASGFPTDPWSMLQFMQQREEAAAERERIRADTQRERDREFFQQMQTQSAQNLQTMLQMQATRPAAGPDSELQRREMAVTMQEMTLKLEKRLASALEGLDLTGGGGDDDDETPAKKPPRSIEEAGTRIGMKLLGELEEKAPDLLEEAIPFVAKWLKAKGFGASEELEDELAALRAKKKKTGTE